MDEENNIRGLSDYALSRMINIDASMYTEHEVQIAIDETKRRKRSQEPAETVESSGNVAHSTPNVEHINNVEPLVATRDAQDPGQSGPDAIESNANICPDCGRKLPEGRTVCLDCVNDLLVRRKAEDAEIFRKKQLWSILLVILAFGILLLVKCGG